MTWSTRLVCGLVVCALAACDCGPRPAEDGGTADSGTGGEGGGGGAAGGSGGGAAGGSGGGAAGGSGGGGASDAGTIRLDGGIWTSAAELAGKPMSGAAWTSLKASADGTLPAPELYNQDSQHPVQTLAVALVWARTGQSSYRTKAAAAVASIIVTGPVNSGAQDGRSLALGRNLAAYVFAADLIDLRTHDPTADQQFRTFLTAARTWTNLEGRSLIECHEDRPNNWGTMCGASRIAADLYLGDTVDLARAVLVLRGYLGDRAAWSAFTYAADAASWMCDATQPRPLNPAGCTRDGHDLSGAPVDDVQRGGPYTWPPTATNYAWGGFSAAAVQAELLHRAGYPAYQWENQAVRRALAFLEASMASSQSNPTEWLPWLVNARYGTSFTAVTPTGFGRLVGWTDYTHAP